jgi:hypothetical protein
LSLRALERPEEFGVLRQQDGDERGDEEKRKCASHGGEDDARDGALMPKMPKMPRLPKFRISFGIHGSFGDSGNSHSTR